MPEAPGRAISNAGVTSLIVAPGGNAGEGPRYCQLVEGGRTCAG